VSEVRPAVSPLRTAVLTCLAMIAFAANSLLCREALRGDSIDPASFGSVRLASGALTLVLLHAARGGGRPSRRGLLAPAMLFAYVAGFSFAYTGLTAGTGALLLFGAVQATMLVAGLVAGERFARSEVAGLVLALAGLGYLVWPGLSAPPPAASALMLGAGVAWGVYSLCGRGSADPLGETARNFLLATPAALAVGLLFRGSAHADTRGVVLAVCSGALTSGVGYAIWFAALRGLTAIRAATVQLSVPAIAAAGGVAFLSERLTFGLAAAAAMILGGVGLAIAGRASHSPSSASR